jgi:RNA polymerase sigma-70 factor (ECF subfamily)
LNRSKQPFIKQFLTFLYGFFLSLYPASRANMSDFVPSTGPTAASSHGAREFTSTQWTLVLTAGDSQAPQSAEALEKLCRAYWYPLYAYVRCRGHPAEEARDLTQEFFARLLEKKWLREVDRSRGRFRTFLLTSMAHFLANDWRASQALKRGGGRQPIALDALEAEERFALEPRDTGSPDALYERRWALTLITRAQDRLHDEWFAAGDGERYTALEPTLAGERTEVRYRELAARFGVAESTVKSWVLRLRRRLRLLLLEEIGQTLQTGQDPEKELQELLGVLER